MADLAVARYASRSSILVTALLTVPSPSLATDKTIKLWKIHEKKIKTVSEFNLDDSARAAPSNQNIYSLKIPRVNVSETIVSACPRKIFANAHAYHINSISMNSDGESYLSADDLRVNLWNCNISDQSFNVVDIKPVNMEELTEVITAAGPTCTYNLHCHVRPIHHYAVCRLSSVALPRSSVQQ